MKKIIVFASIWVLFSELSIAQNKGILEDTVPIIVSFTNLPARQFVQECDSSNSHVTYLSAYMEVSEKKLPKSIGKKTVKRYKLYSKSRNVILSLQYLANNKVIFWLEGKDKHCFILNPLYKFSFTTYYLTEEFLEVYGKVKWDKSYQNFRIIFYSKNSKVNFDFDDVTLRVLEEQR